MLDRSGGGAGDRVAGAVLPRLAAAAHCHQRAGAKDGQVFALPSAGIAILTMYTDER